MLFLTWEQPKTKAKSITIYLEVIVPLDVSILKILLNQTFKSLNGNNKFNASRSRDRTYGSSFFVKDFTT